MAFEKLNLKRGPMGPSFYQKNIIIILPINQEWGHYLEMSDRGLDVLNERYQDQYIKASVWDFPVMTERKRLICYLLYDLFIMDLSLLSVKTNNWSADNLKKNKSPNELYYWARNTVSWHWSVDNLFDSCQLSIRIPLSKLNTDCICLGHLPSYRCK